MPPKMQGRAISINVNKHDIVHQDGLQGRQFVLIGAPHLLVNRPSLDDFLTKSQIFLVLQTLTFDNFGVL